MQLIMQKLLAMAVSTVMTKLMIVFKVSFFMALKFLIVNVLFLFLFFVLNTHTLQKSLMTLIINARLGLFAVGALSAASAVGSVGLQLVHTLDGGIELKA